MSTPDADVDLTAELARLSKIEQAATPGPWGTLERHGRDIADEGWSEVHVVGGPESEPLAATFVSHTLETDNTEADTAFIVESRTAFPRLRAAVEAVLAIHCRSDKPVKTHSLCRDHAALAHHSGRMPVEVIAICPECTVAEKYVCAHCRHECPDDDRWPCLTYLAVTREIGSAQQRGGGDSG